MSYPSFSFLEFQSIDVETDSFTNLGGDFVTLQGIIKTVTSRDGVVDAYFEYRKTGESAWTQTSTVVLPAQQGSFSVDLDNLDSDTSYEFRVIAIVESPVEDQGNIASFTTTAAGTGNRSISSAMRLARSYDDNDASEIEAGSSEDIRTSQMLDRRAFGNQV
jgi:hypothetical protein